MIRSLLNNLSNQAKRAIIAVALIAGLMLLPGCKRDEVSDWDLYYRYFPVEEGHWVLYQVDSIAYNKLQDTVIAYNYLVRETLGECYNDLEGHQWQKISHEVLWDSVAGWQNGAVFSQKRTRGTAERLENNLRFIRLVFPFRNYTYWKGNSYIHYDDLFNCNFYGDWDYRYKDLFVDQTISDKGFDSVVVVQQIADSGLVCKSLGIEMYAPGIGLIYKQVERLTTQQSSSDPFCIKAEDGYILRYSILDWKKD